MALRRNRRLRLPPSCPLNLVLSAHLFRLSFSLNSECSVERILKKIRNVTISSNKINVHFFDCLALHIFHPIAFKALTKLFSIDRAKYLTVLRMIFHYDERSFGCTVPDLTILSRSIAASGLAAKESCTVRLRAGVILSCNTISFLFLFKQI